MQLSNGKGLVHVVTGTDFFTGVMADSAADAGERMLFFKEFQCFSVLALVDKGDVALDTYMGRTGGFTGRGAAFINNKCTRDGLGIFLESSLTIREPFIIFVGACNGADLGTFAAAGAFVRVDEAGFLVNFCRKITGLSIQFHQFRVGEQFDVEMPADLDQFR